jgi:DNA helicase-2/ATP-dependent DNA helicase PcrA
VAYEFQNSAEYEGKLDEFLEKVMLVSDIDGYDENEDSVVLMTVHSAKGLEFPVVFISGMEEELFPGLKEFDAEHELEEERRLCYVAITRAKEKLYMTRAMSRFKYGQRLPSDESRFLREVPYELTEDASGGVMKTRNTLESIGISIKPEPKIMRYEEKKEPTPAINEFDFKPGDRVRHRKFGDGTVVTSQAIGRDAIVVIDFDTAGNKRLMAAFAKLERII